jgi:hypothetical protein
MMQMTPLSQAIYSGKKHLKLLAGDQRAAVLETTRAVEKVD